MKLASVPTATSAALAALLASATGCPERPISSVVPQQASTEIKNVPAVVNRELDLLFVIDNSRSMAEEQASLEANFDKFIGVLERVPGGLPDLHIAVVTSDVGASGRNLGRGCDGYGDAGAFNTRSRGATGDTACSQLGTATFIDMPDAGGARSPNFTGALTDAFACIAHVGDQGCGLEQHLHSMQRALDPATNPGFLRPEAQLGIVIIADEDDCSAADGGALFDASLPLGSDVAFRCFSQAIACDQGGAPDADGRRDNCHPVASPYLLAIKDLADQVKRLKPGAASSIFVAGIFGDTAPVAIQHVTETDGTSRPDVAPSCRYTDAITGAPQTARPGIRLAAFLGEFGDHAISTTICDGDLSDALEQIGIGIGGFIGDLCLDKQPIDTVPTTPAIDPECRVTEITRPDTAEEQRTIIPACADAPTAPTCWTLAALTECAATASGLGVSIVRNEPAVLGSRILAQCAVE